MAELVLGAFLPLLIDKSASASYQYLRDFIHSVGVDELLDDWSKKLQIHRDVLEDAEEKQLTNKEVKRWLDDLHDLLYDVDDFVDELAYEAQARRIKSSNRSRASTSRFPNCTAAASLFNNCGINPAAACYKFYHKMKPKIEEISRRLQDISQRRGDLGLKQINILGREPVMTVSPPLRTTTSLPPTRVFGRVKEKEEIMDMLLKPGVEDAEIPVITILGMGGMGKTTLAQDVYHDESVVKCFDLKAWVCVSDVFDVTSITRTILKQIPNTEKLDFNQLDFNQLQEKLKQMLSGKKFLLVFDDIWNENYNEWDVLRRPFHFGAAGSRILATTRNKPVASTMSRTNEPYVLGVMGDDDGLSLLALHALGREDFHDHPDLKESGKQIVEKCGRLPLAIKTIAGLLLHIPQERKQWEDVLNNKKWTEESNGILPALQLSYYHLPYHLRQCFAYCSIIPKDYIFDKTDLVLLWMAEGLLQQPTGGNSKQTEDFGHDCFQELLSRSFFQLTSGSTTQFIMHDLINDLAVHVAGERCFRMDDEWDENQEYKISDRTRHLSFICQCYEVPKKFNIFDKAHRSRTFLPLPHCKFHVYEYKISFYMSYTVLALTLSRLRSLRVLNLRHYQIVELPNVIGALKHLRYLNLSYTLIEHLPQFVCSLYNLQTLSLNNCVHLCELPSNIGCLMNLRHLDLENTPKLQKMPSWIGNLTSLQTLSKITVGRDTGSCNLKDLKNLIHLHGTLSIEELQNVTDHRDAVAADLRSREHLENVKLQWCFWDSSDSSHDRQLENRVLEKLQPHCNLKVFHIEGYGGFGFPSWVGGQSMSNVVKIHLQGCSEITQLPPLGELPLLKDLVIEGLGSITSVGAEFYGNCVEQIAYFPSLETLSFCEMRKWNVWSPPVAGKGLFPRLRNFKIVDCRELGIIPTLDLPFLCSLELRGCNHEGCRDGSLISLSPYFASLVELTIRGCPGLESFSVTCFPTLRNLVIWDCADLKSLPDGIQGLASLEFLLISNCGKLGPIGDKDLPPSLITLCIENVGGERKKEKSVVLSDWGFHSLTSLRSLELLGFEEVREGDSNSTSTSYLFPPSLTVLGIWSFPNLESLSNGLHNLTSLRHLEICNCPKLESLAGADDDETSL